MIVEGTGYWASIKTPNTTFEPVYTINLVVEQSVADDFAGRGHTIKKMDEGPALVIKRKVNGPVLARRRFYPLTLPPLLSDPRKSFLLSDPLLSDPLRSSPILYDPL